MTCYFRLTRLLQYLKGLCIKNLKKVNPRYPIKKKLEKRDICDTFFYLAGVKYKIRLNSWNTKYSQDVTCTCKNVLSVNHTLLKCPITTVISEAWVGL